MIKQVLFDIGNVLLRFDHTRATEKIQPHAGKPIEEVREDLMALNKRYESGQISRREFLDGAFSIMDYRGEEDHFVTSWQDIFTEITEMSRLAEQLKGRYPLYVLSNTSCIHVDYFTRRYPVFKLFEKSVYSHLAGAMKPDDHIYNVAIRDLGIDPAETFYIDDLEPNIQAGRRFGFVSHQYDWRNHDALLRDMQKAGITV